MSTRDQKDDFHLDGKLELENLPRSQAPAAILIDAKRERAVVWKLDLFIAPVIMLLQLISYLDRSNIGFAATQGLSTDIKLVGTQFNVAVSIFYVFYILAEFPTSIFVKRLQFNRVIPIIAFSWGLVCMCTGFVNNYEGLVATRLTLGLAEGCLFPSLSLFLLNWYVREEIATRIAFLFGSAALSGAFGGLLAYAILHMDGIAGLAGWRWLYILEGLITIFFSGVCYFLIPKSFETAYFLNEDDKVIMRLRAERAESYSGGAGHFSWKDVKLALTDVKVWVSGLCQFASITVLYGFGTFLPLIIKNGFNFSVIQAQYLTIPVYVWGTIIYFVAAILSDKYSSRLIPLLVFAPVSMIGYALLLSPVSSAVKYFSTFLVATGCYICAGINFAWLATNSAPDGKRAASVGLQQTLAQLAGVVSGQIYYSAGAPSYTLGHAWSLGSLVVAWIGWLVFWTILKRRESEKEIMRAEERTQQGLWDDRAPEFIYQM